MAFENFSLDLSLKAFSFDSNLPKDVAFVLKKTKQNKNQWTFHLRPKMENGIYIIF